MGKSFKHHSLYDIKKFTEEVGLTSIQTRGKKRSELVNLIFERIDPYAKYSPDFINWYDSIPEKIFDSFEKWKNKTYNLSKSNPGLHLLYVKWACKHLCLISKFRTELYNQSNNNLINIIAVIDSEVNNLIKNNKAYEDAAEILESIKEFITNKEENHG